MEVLSAQFDEAIEILKDSESNTSDSTLPVGVGFLTFLTKIHDAVAIVAKYRPVAVWLSCAPTTPDYAVWTKAIRGASPKSDIWIQVASVGVAVEVARSCAPDVLIMQSSDAGGHGKSPGAGIVSLVPETRDALDSIGFESIPLLAAGGICDGRGVAAAIVCGAEGVVLGTTFLASKEIILSAVEYQEAILEAVDGGVSTVRGTVFDELNGTNIWPAGYDGRALVAASYRDFQAGVSIDELRKRNAEAVKGPDKGFGGERRPAIWVGAGVGLLKEVKPAGDIVQNLREGARRALTAGNSRR